MTALRHAVLLSLAVLLVSCGPALTWVGPGTPADRDADLAYCRASAPSYTPTNANTSGSSNSSLGEAIGDAGETMGQGLQAAAAIEAYVDACMMSRGYQEVEADSERAHAFEQQGAGVPARGNPRAQGSGEELLVFGGRGHDTFLGCLSCSRFDSDSILNEYGPHGSEFAPDSIWNPYSDFGSPFSQYSACNEFASDPPVIVDEAGGYYGRLTINTTHPDASLDTTLQELLSTMVCADR